LILSVNEIYFRLDWSIHGSVLRPNYAFMRTGVFPNLLKATVTALLICVSVMCYSQQTAMQTTQGIWFYEYLPPSYATNTNKYPVVFFLHGTGEKGNTEAELTRVTNNGPPRSIKNGWRPDFIMVSPQLKTAYGGWPNTYIDNVIEHYKAINPRVDLSRIYLVGLSLGGGGVWQYSQEAQYGQKLAAIVPVCGSGNSPSKACNFGITNLPVWAHHGDADDVVNVSKSITMVDAINACVPAPSPLAKLSIYPGIAHNSWDIAFKIDNTYHTPNVWQWLMQFKNGTLVANAGADKSINLPTNSTTITGSGTVQNATISSYTWSKVSGPASTLANTNTATLSLTNLGEGIHLFRLLVKASNGEMAQDEVQLTVIGNNIGPTANAGPDKALTLPTNSINITGTGSDPDGTIAAYAWTKVSGPSVTENGKSTSILKLTNMVAGTYVYSLKVTDNIGYTATDDVRIVVSTTATNQLPTVNAGADKTINLPTNSTNLTATASDPDGTITAYLWEKVSGPAAGLANSTNATANVTGLVAGVYVFRVTVTDNLGGKSQDNITVTVVAANQAPAANAGSDITITLPTNSTNINGTGSDADGSITSYVWSVVNGPNAPNLTNSASSTVTISGLVQGTYTFRLTVTDNSSATSFDEVQVVVKAAVVNSPPVANAGSDKIINLPTNSTSIIGSGSDPDGSIATYAWTKTSGPAATLTNTNAATLLLSNLVAGVYQFQLTVTDNQGATGTDLVTVTVEAANQSPTANAGSDVTITLPTSTATVSGSGSDPDGSIATYLWQKVSGPSGETLANAATSTLTLTGLTQGVYVFSLTVTDDKGFSDADEVTVTVNALPVNAPPAANAGADKNVTLPTNTSVFNGSGTDTDGTIASYSWILVTGPACTLSGQSTANLSVSNLVAGSYTFRLTVTDNGGATDTDDVILSVQPQAVNQAPVANAGSDVTLTLPTNSATLNGSGTDADGTIASYIWTKLTGPAATMTGTTTANLALTNLIQGVYTFQLSVTDDKGSIGSDVVTVNVNAQNVAPVANAGADITLNLPANSTPIAGAATDSDGTISTYVWSQTSGPSSATLSGVSSPNLTASNLLQGTYIFRLTVTDDDGAIGTDDVKIIVNAANLAPTANAGSNKTITLPTNTTTFTGLGTDTDGTIASYSWSQVGASNATLSNQNTVTLTVVVPASGTYTFRLTVTDNDGASAFDDVILTVNDAVVNQAPTANAGGNKSITLPVNAINLSGSGSDPDGSIASYSWSKISGPSATLTNDNTATLSLSNLVEGTYIFRLTVTDNGGLNATSNATVTVLPAIVNAAPVANAGANQTLTLPTNSVNISGSGSDADGSVVSYSWTKVSGPFATITNQNLAVVSISDLVQGTYVFRLTVFDDKGASGTDDVTVTVNSTAVNQLPVANAGADQNITLPVNTLTLGGSGSDADGAVTQYAWTKISGPVATMNGTTTNTLSLSNLLEGTYVFRLKVTDDDGGTGTDDISVTVQPATVNQSPVANAGADQSITLPTDGVTIFGSGSDPDGSVVSYAWTKQGGPSATLSNQSTPTLTVAAMIEGTYVFRLTVTDDKGAIDTDDITVVVNAATVNQLPLADAGVDLTVTLPTSIATLAGAGSDADGSIVQYTWVKVSGPTVTLTGTTNATLSLSNLLEGTYVFRLTVKDDDAATDFDETTVTVLPAAINDVPVVNAGADIVVFSPQTTASLNGDATDSDGNLTSIEWTQVSGAAATIATPGTLFTQVNNLAVGTYRFRLSVTDNGSATAFDEVEVVVEPATTNQPPFANAGEDKTIKLPANSTTLTGAGTDPDGSISTYLWEVVTGPAVTLGGANASTLSLTNLVEGIYTIRLTVTDDDNATAEDIVQITVIPASMNLSPVANAGTDRSVELPDNQAVINGTASDDATGFTILWEKIEGPAATLTNANTKDLTVQNLLEGTYVFRLTVTDAGGLVATDEITLTVFAEPDAPGLPVVNAGADVTITLPANSVRLAAVASAADGLIVSYFWQQLSGPPIILDPVDSSVLIVNNLTTGTYTFAVTVKDGNDKAASDEVIVNVIGQGKKNYLLSPDLRGPEQTETWSLANAEALSDCEINVYDRQGQKVYASIGYPQPWDGTYNGKTLPSGAYFYVIRCGGKITDSGSITIARIK
jgi:gliding motility-associated-like protein